MVCSTQKSSIFFIFFGLPTGDPEIERRPHIRENTEESIGSKTAPTKWSLPLGLIILKYKFQSNLTFTVDIKRSNFALLNLL